VGNLAAIPLLRATDLPIEPVSAWFLWTAASVVVIGPGLFLGARTGLGAPLLEGLFKGRELGRWGQRVVALALLVAIAGSLPFVLVNLNVSPEGYPAVWKLVLASVDAGVQEEIFMRLFLMTFLVWLGCLVGRSEDGRPRVRVVWSAIVLSGLLFGWGHVGDQIAGLGLHPDLLAILLVNTLFGIAFGWLYWTHGLESAILAHFLVDAIGSGLALPAYLSGKLWFRVIVSLALLCAAALCVYVLMRREGLPAQDD
jgi:hypothetical protein